jgi:lipocalin
MLIILFIIGLAQAVQVEYVREMDVEKQMGEWYVVASVGLQCQCPTISERLVDAHTVEMV